MREFEYRYMWDAAAERLIKQHPSIKSPKNFAKVWFGDFRRNPADVTDNAIQLTPGLLDAPVSLTPHHEFIKYGGYLPIYAPVFVTGKLLKKDWVHYGSATGRDLLGDPAVYMALIRENTYRRINEPILHPVEWMPFTAENLQLVRAFAP